MASGARRAGEGDWALALSGIAGPGGGSEDKPVGLVYVGLAHPDATVEAIRCLFGGDRGQVRRRAVQAALDLLRRRLFGVRD